MADQILDEIRDILDGQIDFEGQKLAEQLGTVALIITGFFSFLVGYTTQDINLALWIGLGGTTATMVLVVPPWPFFRKNPVKWLPVGGSSSNSKTQPTTVIFEPSKM